MRFTTRSGSTYEIRDNKIRRVNADHEKRGDGEWLTLVTKPIVTVGEQAAITTESLSRFGGDDYGTPQRLVGPHTTRITSTVISIEDD